MTGTETAQLLGHAPGAALIVAVGAAMALVLRGESDRRLKALAIVAIAIVGYAMRA